MKKQIGIFTAILFAVSTLMVGCKAEVHTHTFAEEWTYDETAHWHAATCGCSDVELQKTEHTFGDWTITKEPTEEAEGSQEKSCSVCEYKVTEAIAKLEHTHKFASEWKSDETSHWHAATCGCSDVELQKKAHTFGEWKVTKEATCTEEGSKTGVCEVCKKEVTEKIDAKGHSLGIWTTTKEATCTEEGSKTGVCEVCKKEVTEKISAKGHSYSGSWTSDAENHWHASTCGHEDEEVKEEHTYVDEVCTICKYSRIPEGFVFVQGGTITGSAYTNNYEGVFIEGRTVTLSDFYMGKYEVTQEEYASVMTGQKVTVGGVEYTLESNPSKCTKDSEEYTLFNGDVQEKRPVEGVSWYDAVWYCNALSEKEDLTKAYNIEVTKVDSSNHITAANVTPNKNANGYRLPTEAEWEYAARGGDPTAADWNYVFSGADTAEGVSYRLSKNSDLDSVGWYCYNNITGTTGDSDVTNNVSGKGTHQVGKKDHNRLGLYDMSGNVFEWCYDWYGTVDNETPVDGTTSGSYRVRRGGSWYYRADSASVSCRYYNYPYYCDSDLGFRVVRTAN